MKRIIRLTENDLVRIVKRVINEQPSSGDRDKIADQMMGKVKPDTNAKYCFTQKKLANEILAGGKNYIKLYKIKTGDTLSKIKGFTEQDLISMNPNCQLNDPKKFRAGDVLMYSTRQSY